MADLTLKQGMVVRTRNGKYGAVVAFNDDVSNMFVVFDSFINYANVFRADGKHRNTNYDILAAYDGSKIASVKDIYRKRFNAEDAGLDVVWVSEEETAE